MFLCNHACLLHTVQVNADTETVDVTEQEESLNSLLCVPPSHPTWLESRRMAVSD